jgi:hypothetical protein
MRPTVIRAPIAAPRRPVNWAAFQACGTIVPPPPRHRGVGAWTARLFVLAVVALVAVPMLLQVTL